MAELQKEPPLTNAELRAIRAEIQYDATVDLTKCVGGVDMKRKVQKLAQAALPAPTHEPEIVVERHPTAKDAFVVRRGSLFWDPTKGDWSQTVPYAPFYSSTAVLVAEALQHRAEVAEAENEKWAATWADNTRRAEEAEVEAERLAQELANYISGKEEAEKQLVDAERTVKVLCKHLSAVINVANGNYVGNEGSEEEEMQSVLNEASAILAAQKGT